MRPQVSNSGGQSTGSNDHKKSVFDRLGHQLDSGRPMKRRPSPGPYGDYMPPPPPVHEADFGRYPRDPHQAEMEWRYQNERRHMSQFSRDRHPPPMQPPPQMHPSHYEMEMSRNQPSYYPPSHPYHNLPPGPLPPLPQGPLGPGGSPMSMQQRSSPKYDRHGNLIVSTKERGRSNRMAQIDHHSGMSPPRTFMPMGPMMHFGHEMPPPEMGMGPGRPPPVGMYPPHPPPRWHDGLEPDFPPHGGRMLPDGRFSPINEPRRLPPQLLSPPEAQMIPGSEAPRYAKWRERRDVITTLDRETAQSSSRTDSLKSTLQQDGRYSSSAVKQSGTLLNNNSAARRQNNQSAANSKQVADITPKAELDGTSTEKVEKNPSSSSIKESKKSEPKVKTEPQDISDGEIVDDEDSSDESEEVAPTVMRDSRYLPESYLSRQQPSMPQSYPRRSESHQYYETASKKRRLHEDYSMDYETISDEDLDDFMGDKKIAADIVDGAKYNDRLRGEDGGNKSISEIELLNALGLDWANLVEMAKQSRNSSKDTYTPGSALPRFSMPNYLPSLAIPADLVGPEIYELILKTCRTS